jgi:hypothetical protein
MLMHLVSGSIIFPSIYAAHAVYGVLLGAVAQRASTSLTCQSGRVISRIRLVGDDGMDWLVWILLAAGLVAVFVVWDMVFCGGRRCREFIDWVGRGDDLK